MSFIGNSRQELAQIAKHFTVEALCSGKTDEAVCSALALSGRGKQRSSPLQPRLVMWLVLCLPLFRSDAIPAVLARLLSGLRDILLAVSLREIEDDAIAHARKRLGVDPLRCFFRQQAKDVAPAPSFHGLRSWALDGTLLSMPDSVENKRIFGLRKSGRGRTAFPQLKMVALQDVLTRRFRDVRFARWNSAERTTAVPMLEHVGEGDLVLLDRGFYAAWFFEAIRLRACHFLCRVPVYAKFKAVGGTKKSGDYLTRIEAPVRLPKEQWRKNSRGIVVKNRQVQMLVRIIEYQVRGFEHVRLVTSVLDRSIPAMDLVLEYHRRWEIELALDEVKTHQSSTALGALKTIFRSPKPRNVMQEAYALVSSYNLVRGLIAEAATRHALDPAKISFIGTLRAISLMVPRMLGAPSTRLRGLYEQLLQDVAEAQIDRPRRPRQYPRVVRQKMSNFKCKKPRDHQRLIDFKAIVRIGA